MRRTVVRGRTCGIVWETIRDRISQRDGPSRSAPGRARSFRGSGPDPRRPWLLANPQRSVCPEGRTPPKSGHVYTHLCHNKKPRPWSPNPCPCRSTAGQTASAAGPESRTLAAAAPRVFASAAGSTLSDGPDMPTGSETGAAWCATPPSPPPKSGAASVSPAAMPADDFSRGCVPSSPPDSDPLQERTGSSRTDTRLTCPRRLRFDPRTRLSRR